MNYLKSDITVFLPTLGDNPCVFDVIENLRNEIPDCQLVVWSNFNSKDHVDRLNRMADIVIDCSVNLGTSKAIGFALLYLEYEYLFLTADDGLHPNGFWNDMFQRFADPSVGIVGESWRSDRGHSFVADPDTFPDWPLIIKKSVIDRIGSIKPAFGIHAHNTLDLIRRAYDNGFKIISVDIGTKKYGTGLHATDLIDKQYFSKEMDRSARVLLYHRFEWFNSKMNGAINAPGSRLSL